LSDSSLKLGGAVWLDGGESLNTNDTFFGLEVAAAISSSVWVVRLELLLVLLEVLVSPLLPSTGAAHVTIGAGAVNELLLGELDKLTGLDLVVTFKGSGGGESPA